MATELSLPFVFIPAGAATPSGWQPEEMVAVPAQYQLPAEPRSLPLLDRDGVAVIGAAGSAAHFPSTLPPEYFVRQAHRLHDLSPDSMLALLATDLYKFRQWGPWDAQRLTGAVRQDWIDYSTIAIGIYGAAVGVSEHIMFRIQNEYAWWRSNFQNAPRSKEWPNLAERNVRNTRIGYETYRSGRIAAPGDR